MKKILYLAATIAEIGLLAGACAVNHFTANRLGMARWVNFHGQKWEDALPIPGIRLAVILALAALSILALCLYLKRRKGLKRAAGAMAVAACLLSAACIGYMLASSFDSMRAYYLICILLTAAAAIQIAKALAGVKACRAG